MKNFYLLFWIWIPILLILAYVFNKELDFAMADNSYVVTLFQISIIVAIFLLISGMGYFLFRNKEIKRSGAIAHLGLTGSGLILLIIMFLLHAKYYRLSYTGDFVEYEYLDESIKIAIGESIGFLLVGVGFTIYLVNMSRMIVKRN